MDIASVLRVGVTFLWFIIIGLIVLGVVRTSRGQRNTALARAILVLVVVAVLMTVVGAGLVFIQPEERGVVISAVAAGGYRQEALQPGLNWIVPFMESVRTYRIARQTYTMSVTSNAGQVEGDDSIRARTADGQEVSVDASVIFGIDPNQVVQVHIDWQDRYMDELIRPLARGVIRDTVSQYGVEEVYGSKRVELTQEIIVTLGKKLDENGLTLVDFVLRDIGFSAEYAASVEQKQIAEQQAQQAKFVVEQRKQEAEQARQVAQGAADAVVIRAQADADSAVIRAKGEAESRLIQAGAEATALAKLAQVVKDNPALLQYLFLTKMAPGVQTIFLPTNEMNYILPLPTPNAAVVPSIEDLLPTPMPTPLPTTTP